MTKTTTFTIGADVSCSDGICGEVIRVVVDPIARIVTHLVVEPKHRRGLGRLVPLDLVDATTDELRLRCTLADFEKLDNAEETEFLPGSSGYEGYGSGQTLFLPYFALGANVPRIEMGQFVGNAPRFVTHDSLPSDEVAVRRGEPVHATDGEIGKVEGLVIEAGEHRVTHVLLQEGHLWGRKQVAIPIAAVAKVDGGIRLSITKQEVHDLPPVDIHHPSL